MIFTQLVSDNFQGDDENPLNPARWSGDSSHTYPSAKIENHKCFAHDTSNVGSLNCYTGINWPNNQYASFTLASSGASFADAQVVLRAASDASNCYAFEVSLHNNLGAIAVSLYFGSNQIIFEEFLLELNQPMHQGDELLFVALGQNFYCFQNKVLVYSFSDNHVASGNAGIFLGGTNMPIINFLGGKVDLSPTQSVSGLGQFQGSSIAKVFPNPLGKDLLQVVDKSGSVVWNLTSTGVANFKPASPTYNSLLGSFEGPSPYAAFQNPGNSDILQVVDFGGHVKFYVDFLGIAYSN